jgi:VWFA-related protein
MLMSLEVPMSWIYTYASPYRQLRAALAIVLLALLVAAPFGSAQAPAPSTQKPQPDQTSPDSGGPGADNGSIALPHKKDQPEDTPPPAPAAPKVKNPEGMSNYSLRVEVPEVTVDVGVLLEKTHQFVPNLKPSNFRVYEDGVEQRIAGFKRVEAPITALLLCEFASTSYWFLNDMWNAAWAFAQQLRPQDYVALMTFDMRTQIVTDFTQDKRQFYQAINSMQMPGFSERNLFDALYEAEDRLSRIEGRKYIILIASGRDTMSKLTLDKILQKVKTTPDITIFTVSTGGAVRAMTEGSSGSWNSQLRDMDYLQADNEMKTFAKLTGGASFRISLATSTQISDLNMSWSITPAIPSRTAPIASCASNWWMMKATLCASRTRSTNRSNTTSSLAMATAHGPRWNRHQLRTRAEPVGRPRGSHRPAGKAGSASSI